MAFSEMSSREKTIIIVLGVVIVIALIGIGVLVAKLVGDKEPVVTVVPTDGGGEAPGPTITPIDTPSLEDLPDAPPAPAGDQPVVVVQAEAAGPGLPAIITSQPLRAEGRYRLEIAAADGSKAAIQGSWSQAATSTDGEVAAPQIEFFEGMTLYTIDIVSPVANPAQWSYSASASPSDILGPPVILVMTLYDVTGSQ